MKQDQNRCWITSLMLVVLAGLSAMSVLAQGTSSSVSGVGATDEVLTGSTSAAKGLSTDAPVNNDRLPLPVPAFGKSNPLGTGLQFGPGGQNQELSPLSSLAPAGIEVSVKITDASVKGLKALKVSVKNNTDRPLAFNGNETTATVGDAHLKAVPMSEISNRIQQPDNPKGYLQRSIENTFTAALTVGTLQTVEGELSRRGPIAGRYGFDNASRSDRLGRFSERILWPGDSTDGIVYFKTDKSRAGASVQIPVADFYDRKDNTSVPATVR